MAKILLSCLLAMLCLSLTAQDIHFVKEEKIPHPAPHRPQVDLPLPVQLPSISSSNNLPLLTYPDPEINFTPRGVNIPAGDINGDGKQDFYRRFLNVPDLYTPDVSDVLNKTLVYYHEETRPDSVGQLVTAALYHAGDLNDDGFADALGYSQLNEWGLYMGSENGLVLSRKMNLKLNPGNSISHSADINGDGYPDAVVNNYSNNKTGATIIFGGVYPEDIAFTSVQLLPASDPGTYTAELYGILATGPQTGSLVKLSSIRSNNAQNTVKVQVAIYKILPAGNTELQEQLPELTLTDYSVYPVSYVLSDLSGNGYDDLLISSGEAQDKAGQSFVIGQSENGFSSPKEISYIRPMPLGDLDGDGKKDLYTTPEPGKLKVIFGDKDLLLDQSLEISHGHLSLTPVSQNPRSLFTDDVFGDVNNDGLADIQFGVSYNDRAGRQIFYGNGTRNIPTGQEVLFETEPYLAETGSYREGENLGDLNGDQVDDLGILELRRIRVFYGGKPLAQPDVTLTAGPNEKFLEIEGLDLDADGYHDLVVSRKTEANEPGQSSYGNIVVYRGGPALATTAAEFSGSSFLSTRFPLISPSLKNAGDVDHDGTEDLLVIGKLDANQVTLLYGSTDLDQAVTRKVQIVSSSTVQRTAAGKTEGFPLHMYRAVKLGDYNGDGIDDFAVATDYSGYSATGTEPGNILTGEINVYYGMDNLRPGATEGYLRSQLLRASPNQGDYMRYFGYNIAAGDFNGDGINDILTTPQTFRNTSGTHPKAGGFHLFSVSDSLGPARFDLALHQGFLLQDHNSELITIPDTNGDDIDEFIFANSGGTLLMLSDSSGVHRPAYTFSGPDEGYGFYTFTNWLNALFQSAVGDFDNDGYKEVYLPHHRNLNYRNTPIFKFEIKTEGKQHQEIVADIPSQVSFTEAADLVVSATSGLPVTVEVLLGPASINGNNQLVATGTGPVSLRLSQPGDSQYFPARSRSFSLEFTKEKQGIDFPAIPDQLADPLKIKLEATSDSGLPVTYSVTRGKATIQGDTLILEGEPGVVSVNATQAGNDVFHPALAVRRTFNVSAVTATASRLAALPRVYPNPVMDRVTLANIQNPLQAENIRLTDLHGRSFSLQPEDLAAGGQFTYTVNLERFKPGIYLLIVRDHKTVYSSRLVKE